jgi:hypothetical protein
VIAWVLVYLFLIRGTRGHIVEQVHTTLHPANMEISKHSITLLPRDQETAITLRKQTASHVVQIFAGQYLLIGITGLLLLSYRSMWLVLITGIHLLASFINGGVLWLGFYNYADLFMISDILQQYVIPVLSLGLIPLALWLDQLQSTSEHR